MTPPFYQNVKERPTPNFITNSAIIGFSKFLRKQKSFSARQNSFWEQKLIYIFTNCMFTEKKQVFQLRIRTSNSNLLSHHKIIGSFVVNLCVKANIHLWPSILFPPPPHFKDLFMIFPVGHFIMTPPTLEKFRKMSTPPANSNPPYN